MKYKFSLLDLFLIFINLSLGIYVLIFSTTSNYLNNILLLIFSLIFGVHLCKKQSISNYTYLLSYFWLIKFFLSLLLIRFSWYYMANDIGNDYDPVRFYRDAYTLYLSDWEYIVPSNYQGAIYYYSIIFFIFGQNPLAPALINELLTLFASLGLINFLSSSSISFNKNLCGICFILIIPEVIWYDIMTSRESLVSVIICFIYIYTQKFCMKVNIKNTSILLILLFLILSIRTVIAVGLLIAVLITYKLYSGKKTNIINLLSLSLFSFLVILFGPLIQSFLGGAEINYLELISQSFSYDENIASKMEAVWSPNSIGLLIAPQNTWQAILFAPIRMILYLVAPLPNFSIIFSDIQSALTALTSLAYIAFLPYVVGGISSAYSMRGSNPKFLSLYIFLFLMLILIAGGNIIIHERYRMMISILYFSSAWFGYMKSNSYNISLYIFTIYSFFALFAFFILIYKYVI